MVGVSSFVWLLYRETEILSGWWALWVPPSIDFDSLVLSGTLWYSLVLSDTSWYFPSILWLVIILWLLFSGYSLVLSVPYDFSAPSWHLACAAMSMYNPSMAKAGLLYLLYSNVNINGGVYLPSYVRLLYRDWDSVRIGGTLWYFKYRFWLLVPLLSDTSGTLSILWLSIQYSLASILWLVFSGTP
jgi:hypothetical protein